METTITRRDIGGLDPKYVRTCNQIGMPIYNSFAATAHRPVTPGPRRMMQYGDKVFVRFLLRGAETIEFMTTTSNDMSEIIGELRRRGGDTRGLGRLIVRNATRGWYYDGPMMLYGRRYPTRMRPRGYDDPVVYKKQEPQQRRMLFPWETH